MDHEVLRRAREVAPIVPHNYTTALCPAFLIQYSPDLGGAGATATAALVQGATDTFTVLVGGVAPVSPDVFIEADGVISIVAAAYNTVGEFVNAVNGLASYRAICLCRPETPMINLLAKAATTMMGANGLAFYLDLAVADTTYINWGCAITGEKFVNNGKAGHLCDYDRRKHQNICINRFHYAQLTCNWTTSGTFRIYEFRPGDATSRLLFTKALTDNTLTAVGNTDRPTEPFIVGRPGYTHVCEVRTEGGTDTMADQIVAGSTVVMNDERIVDEAAHIGAD